MLCTLQWQGAIINHRITTVNLNTSYNVVINEILYVYINRIFLPVYYPYYVLTHEDYSRRLKTAFYGR